ncbi:hypothetical protein AIIKEEIJ_04602 [Rhodococcus sp. YH1]|nr:hypothetical protein [Rhodococcus sp. YH1]
MTKPACDSMSNHRRPDSLAHDESEPRTAETHHQLGLLPLDRVNDQISPPLSAATTNGLGKVRAAPQAIRLR